VALDKLAVPGGDVGGSALVKDSGTWTAATRGGEATTVSLGEKPAAGWEGNGEITSAVVQLVGRIASGTLTAA
jgi:hypothetical protein